MAAPAPADNGPFFVPRSDSNNKQANLDSIETRMSGMSLLEQSGHVRRTTESTMSSSPPGEGSTRGSSAPASPVPPPPSQTPISKPPNLTLTPNSDAGSFLPFQEGPFVPYVKSQNAPDGHRRGGSSSNFGSGSTFATGSTDNNDGLLGLEALHGGTEPSASSPRVAQRYERRSSDRPPLSQTSYADSSSVLPFSASTSRSGSTDPNNTSMESTDSSRIWGAIGPNDPSRRRASSQEYSLPSQNNAGGNTFAYSQEATQKFGTLPSLGHLKNQQNFGVERPRHMRSVSQPGPQQAAPQPDMRFQHSANFETSSYKSAGSHRSGSYVQPGPSYNEFKPGYGPYPSLDRHQSLDFPPQQGATGYVSDGFATPSTVSPGHSPHQVHYASMPDGLSSSASSLPLQGVYRSHHGHYDDDLVGEHIEVPDEVHHLPGYMMRSSGSHGSHPLLRGAPHHAHSHSLDGGVHHQVYQDHRPAPPKVVYAVKFKRSQRNFVLGPRISRDLKIGTYVKVEADRGEDLGIVVGKVPAEKFTSYSGRYTAGMGPNDLKRIIRLATHDEVSLLSMKREEEEELLRICRGKVHQRGLPMNVVDAEYQFDRHKLTFFFEAEGRVDFRELVRDLFSMYKTRIWMQQLDKNTAASNLAITAPLTANLPMDYGTPIIAPVSEFADSIILNGATDTRSH